jgi:hypothetical protein
LVLFFFLLVLIQILEGGGERHIEYIGFLLFLSLLLLRGLDSLLSFAPFVVISEPAPNVDGAGQSQQG